MKKYLQITVVLTAFFIFVFAHNHIEQENKAEDVLVNINKKNTVPAPTSTPVATSAPGASNGSTPVPASTAAPKQAYKDGTYTGSVEDAFYGLIQVQAVIANGKITDVIFLQHPNDNGTSQNINSQAMPLLKQEVLQAQNAQVDIVSGASASSQAFQASLANALAKAK